MGAEGSGPIGAPVGPSSAAEGASFASGIRRASAPERVASREGEAASARGAAGPQPPSFQEALAELSRVEGRRGTTPPPTVSKAAQLAWSAREFETYFLQQLWRIMRESVPRGGLFERSQGERIFEEMLDEERSHLMARTGQLGLAQMIYERTIRYVQDK